MFVVMTVDVILPIFHILVPVHPHCLGVVGRQTEGDPCVHMYLSCDVSV